jgi:hypothetical protein
LNPVQASSAATATVTPPLNSSTVSQGKALDRRVMTVPLGICARTFSKYIRNWNHLEPRQRTPVGEDARRAGGEQTQAARGQKSAEAASKLPHSDT